MTEYGVKLHGRNQDRLTIHTGVRQGSVLAPLLFGLFLFIGVYVKKICSNEDRETTLAYVDDVAMVTYLSEDLQRADGMRFVG